jgi:8-oxo-dGTP diphosphatase
MTEPLRPFGRRTGGLEYRPRAEACGILFKDGRIARVGYGPYTYDLPGGGIDQGETPEMAVEREFGKETGLKVRVTGKVTEILHYWIHDDGTPYNNHCGFHLSRSNGMGAPK